ncbi:hypothetical protein MASR1M8_09510 [Thermomonas brevis]
MNSPSPHLDLQGIDVRYPGAARCAVAGVDLQLGRGEIGVLLGASGSGKTTVLRALAGFEALEAGHIDLDGRRIAEAGRGLPPEQRRLGMMFQDFALFPHLDVAANIAFGLRGRDRQARAGIVGQWLARIGLAGHERRYPHELSGGQQQRVALARALAPEPALLLLDEPFSALDVDTRQRLIGELRGLFAATGTTVLMVTHDQHEAFGLGDRIGVMADGRLLQWDLAEALYRRPATPEVANFIGRGTLLPPAVLGLAGEGWVLLRPEQLRVDDDGALHGQVLDVRFLGPGEVAQVWLADGHVVEIDVLPGIEVAVGQAVRLSLRDEDALPHFV